MNATVSGLSDGSITVAERALLNEPDEDKEQIFDGWPEDYPAYLQVVSGFTSTQILIWHRQSFQDPNVRQSTDNLAHCLTKANLTVASVATQTVLYDIIASATQSALELQLSRAPEEDLAEAADFVNSCVEDSYGYAAIPRHWDGTFPLTFALY